ncbi:MAG: hypothetical protein PVI26_09135 [Chitinispirillia bacterium]
MENETQKIVSIKYFSERRKEVVEKIGRKLLNDDDIFILMCEKLLKSYTYEEKKYMNETHEKQ